MYLAAASIDDRVNYVLLGADGEVRRRLIQLVTCSACCLGLVKS